MNHNSHFAEVMLSFSSPTSDPRGLAQTDLSPDYQGVARILAAAVGIVVLQGLEVTVGMESVGAGKKLWTRTNFASKCRRRKII